MYSHRDITGRVLNIFRERSGEEVHLNDIREILDDLDDVQIRNILHQLTKSCRITHVRRCVYRYDQKTVSSATVSSLFSKVFTWPVEISSNHVICIHVEYAGNGKFSHCNEIMNSWSTAGELCDLIAAHIAVTHSDEEME